VFLGHYGLAFAAKRIAPRTSLGTLTFAAQWLDELWPVLLLAGIEQVRIVPGLMAASPIDFTYYPFLLSPFSFPPFYFLLSTFYSLPSATPPPHHDPPALWLRVPPASRRPARRRHR